VRIGAIPLFVLPIYCIYLTYSKGAFVAGFAAIVASLTFGRHKTVQLLILMTALTAGWAGVQALPRMQELENAQSDEAIRGRLEAFRFGREMVTQKLTGLGKDRFTESMLQYRGFRKAAHSSFVAVGGELGMPGFVMFFALLYCCMRTLVTAKTRDVDEERVRRILFAMLVSYMVSSWMVDFAYRASLFMNIAAVAAFHRLLLRKQGAQEQNEETVQETLTAIPRLSFGGLQPAPALGAPMRIDQSTIAQTTIDIPLAEGDEPKLSEQEQAVAPGLVWNKFGLMDWLMVAAITFAAYMFWGYIMHNI
jgi:O-antigen ligase